MQTQLVFAVTTGDYNGDGIVDLIASGGWFRRNCMSITQARNNNTVVLFGDGKGNFKKGWKKVEPYDIYGSGFLPSVVNMVSWDFDGDGDLDISGTTFAFLFWCYSYSLG